MRVGGLLLVVLGLMMALSGCSSWDAEDREFYHRDILHPRMDGDEREFWYGSWRKSEGLHY